MLMRVLTPFREWMPGEVVDVPRDQCRDLVIAEIVEPYSVDQLADLEPDDLPDVDAVTDASGFTAGTFFEDNGDGTADVGVVRDQVLTEAVADGILNPDGTEGPNAEAEA
jgi:hypothetical protein